MKLPVYSVLAMLALAPSGARADAVADCNNDSDLTRQIRGCTKVISKTMLGDPLSTAYMNRGIAYAQRKDLKKAVADFSSSINANSANNFAYYNRGNVYLDLGKPKLAIADYSKALEIAPDMSPALLNRGLANEMVGDKDASIADFRAALALEPTLYAAIEGLKRLGADVAIGEQSSR
ncbi:tetratricopeptide repeat protein [Hyphomicrobium sp.]|uniref:tetratricopeptide repeat protein n=1 Tax=Hyphomicrobium sp. TaxID=82 RepID=UPI000F9CD90D|nr:tetratricopeptide repeat protein [Hyphomicrobium sp.]RUO99715.1 MAG: tetratricopeptide repeat protein [Hyphomicrobium sp.]